MHVTNGSFCKLRKWNTSHASGVITLEKCIHQRFLQVATYFKSSISARGSCPKGKKPKVFGTCSAFEMGLDHVSRVIPLEGALNKGFLPVATLFRAIIERQEI